MTGPGTTETHLFTMNSLGSWNTCIMKLGHNCCFRYIKTLKSIMSFVIKMYIKIIHQIPSKFSFKEMSLKLPSAMLLASWSKWNEFNRLRPEQNGHHFAHEIFNLIFLASNTCIWNKSHRSLFPKVQWTKSDLPNRFMCHGLWRNEKVKSHHTQIKGILPKGPYPPCVILPKGPIRHAYAWQIGPFWQDTLEIWNMVVTLWSILSNRLYTHTH